MRKSIFIEICIILCLAVISAMAVNILRPNGIPLKGSGRTDGPSDTPAAVDQSVSIEQSVVLYQKGDVLFVDSRSREEFDLGHVKGAVHLPKKSFDEKFGAFLTKWPPDTRIITYCSSRDCSIAEEIAEELGFAGFENVQVMVDGWDEWQKRKLPVEP